jgi:hypothetical protein
LTATPTPAAAARKAVAAADPPKQEPSIVVKDPNPGALTVTAKPPAISNIHTAILAASVNFGPLEKDGDNPYYKSKYLTLGALLNAVRPALTDEGVVITGGFSLIPQGWVVETILYHTSSGTDLTSLFPVTDVTGSQKIGAAGTFGMRYNLLQLLGIAAADDDGNSTSNLTPPDDFLGPAPAGQQRTEPRRLPTRANDFPPTTPEEDWL